MIRINVVGLFYELMRGVMPVDHVSGLIGMVRQERWKSNDDVYPGNYPKLLDLAEEFAADLAGNGFDVEGVRVPADQAFRQVMLCPRCLADGFTRHGLRKTATGHRTWMEDSTLRYDFWRYVCQKQHEFEVGGYTSAENEFVYSANSMFGVPLVGIKADD